MGGSVSVGCSFDWTAKPFFMKTEGGGWEGA